MLESPIPSTRPLEGSITHALGHSPKSSAGAHINPRPCCSLTGIAHCTRRVAISQRACEGKTRTSSGFRSTVAGRPGRAKNITRTQWTPEEINGGLRYHHGPSNRPYRQSHGPEGFPDGWGDLGGAEGYAAGDLTEAGCLAGDCWGAG